MVKNTCLNLKMEHINNNNISEQTFPGTTGRSFPGTGGSQTFPGTGNGQSFPGSNMFACLLTDATNKLEGDTVIWQGDDTKWTFFNNNRWFNSKNSHKGTWSCKANNAGYIIKDDDGDVYDSTTNKWVNPNEQRNSSTGNTTTITDTNLTGDDLAAGKVVKVGMRGEIVGKIQELLIAKGFTNVSKNKTADKIFGNRTKRMVMAFQALNGLNDDGIVGKDTWAKLNDASAVSAGNSSSTNQATSVKNPDEVPGSDSTIMQESRKKLLRKYLQEFK